MKNEEKAELFKAGALWIIESFEELLDNSVDINRITYSAIDLQQILKGMRSAIDEISHSKISREEMLREFYNEEISLNKIH